MLQDLPAASVVPPQAWPAGAVRAPVASPVTAAAVTLKGSVPLLRTPTDWDLVVLTVTVPNVTGFGETTNVEPAPVPVRATRVLTPVSLGISSVAVREPMAVGLNVTLIEQVAMGSICPHVVAEIL